MYADPGLLNGGIRAASTRRRPSSAHSAIKPSSALGEHCAMVFERIDMFNEEIEAAREEGRKPDQGTVQGVHSHRTLRKRERLAAGEAWEDSGRFNTDERGRPVHPEYVSRRFR
jgi:hypothetical protein